MSKKVIILGGGVAGLSAAHELAERGFSVEVYERNSLVPGGKARSFPVPGTFEAGGLPLTGEHGFRFFPGFYKHLPDTMKRIPFGKKSVYDNLVAPERIMVARYDQAPIITVANFPHSISDVKLVLNDIFGGVNSGLSKEEIDFFSGRVWQLMTSCYDRRLNDYERIGWWEFCEADRFSKTYQSLLVEGLTRTLVAAKAEVASTKTGGDIFLQLIFNMMMPFVDTDRVLNGPTNEMWIYPWLLYLAEKGVKYHINAEALSIESDDKQITGANVMLNGSVQKVTGDYYLLATPVEVAAKLLNDNILKLDSSLSSIQELAGDVSWMNGIQFYLNEEVTINKGHVIYCDSEWALTSISQLQFWYKNFDIEKHYNGKVKTILSVDVSDWETPGLNGKYANQCTLEEIKTEVWAQLKKSLNVEGKTVLRDEQIEFWFLDRDISETGTEPMTINKEPLLVNHTNSWTLRPSAHTFIPNLFLASDYVKTYTDLATMEGANEAARRAVNSIIDVSDTKTDLCKIWNLHEPDMLMPFRHHDQKRYEKGLPWKDEFSGIEMRMSAIKSKIHKI
ncbi:MAG TPA: FAD-dependent oxidoreductase [Bacteroidia bacterium]|nr:FAD-dependent oxidoreductase [Bacteroidia bacterium]